LKALGYALLVGLAMALHGWAKTMIPEVGGYWADPMLADFDQRLFGQDPWQMFSAIGFGSILAKVYVSWFPVTFGMMGLLAFSKRDHSVLLTAFLAILIFVGICYSIMYFSYNRAVSFMDDLPKYSTRIRETVIRVRQRTERFQKTAENVLPSAPDEKNAVKVKQSSNWADRLTEGAGAVTELVLLIGFIPFLTYFMLSWQEHFRSSTVMLFKLEHRNTAYVTLGLISAMIRSFIVGNLVVGIFISLISTVVFAFLHLPYFYFLGVLSGFLSLVPYLGVVLALIPPIAAGLGQINSEQLIMVVVAVLGLHLFALNVLYPKIIGKRLQLNPLAVTLALLFWGWLWGAMGLILAVPITAAMKIVFDHVDGLRPWGAWLGE